MQLISRIDCVPLRLVSSRPGVIHNLVYLFQSHRCTPEILTHYLSIPYAIYPVFSHFRRRSSLSYYHTFFSCTYTISFVTSTTLRTQFSYSFIPQLITLPHSNHCSKVIYFYSYSQSPPPFHIIDLLITVKVGITKAFV